MTPNITTSMRVPTHLYKYRYLGPLSRIEQILLTNRIHFSSPVRFNDPFDCKVGPLGSLDPAFLKTMIEARLATGVGPSPAEARLAEGDTDAYKDVRVELQKRVNGHGILSLSEHRDDILLWSHYADMHRGICLEFATDKWPALKFNALPVVYSGLRPSVSFTQDAWNKARFATDIALTKQASWSYEKEWRFVKRDGEGLVEFPAHALTGVVFGCEIPKRKFLAVMRLIGRRTERPVTYKAIKDERKFALVMEQFD